MISVILERYNGYILGLGFEIRVEINIGNKGVLILLQKHIKKFRMIVIVKGNSKKLGFMRICKVLKGCYKVGIGLDL